jgi:hypothetical protein
VWQLSGLPAPRIVPPLVGRLALSVAAILAPAAIPAGAQTASGYVELTATSNDVETEDPGGQRSEGEGGSFQQRYGLDLAWTLYPNFTVRAGGLFDRADASAEGDFGSTDATLTRIRPYLNARLRTAIFSAYLEFFRTEQEQETGVSSTRDIQDSYRATLGWRPIDLPSLTIRLIRTEDFDENRRFRDTTTDIFDLTSKYSPVDELQLYYRGQLQEFNDNLLDNNTERTFHSGRVTYGDAWWDRRVRFDAEYDVDYRATETTSSGLGDIFSPLFPFGGLSVNSDELINVMLSPNPALIDADPVVNAGIDLLYSGASGDNRLRHIGLDFGSPVTLNTLFLTVDRNLTSAIAALYVWDVYTSDDNLVWVERASSSTPPPPTVTFGPILPRFEIGFADLTTRYVKVVTSPLDTNSLGPSNIPNIFVTELGAALRTPAAEVEGRSSATSQLLSSSLRTRILESPALTHELAYSYRDPGTSARSTYDLSNGLSLRHAWNEVYSMTARLAHQRSQQQTGEQDGWVYTASLRANPFPTLQNTLVFSGRSLNLDGESSDSQSLFLYSNAELYEGINANLGVGASTLDRDNGESVETARLNAQMTLVPHRTVSFNLTFQNRRSKRSGGALPEERIETRRRREVSVSYRPLNTLYFFFSYRQEGGFAGGDRFLRSYSASWSPFPGGALQFIFGFDERYQSELDTLSRFVTPRIRWNMTNRWYWELAYQKSTFDSELQLRNEKAWVGTMRYTF